MSLDVFLLILRMAIIVALYLFLGLLLWYGWQDIRLAGQQMQPDAKIAARLIVVECDGAVPLKAGMQFPLEKETLLGRGPVNTIILPDSFASNRHAIISIKNGQWWLEDQNSRNGTRLNGVDVVNGVVISAGDVIEIGRVRLMFECG
ncbi:MAG: FHA domain-containing protein [Anaerolineae bacterium]|nr:FHA domain-containing protein [Anaerolineae bacterium]